MRPALVLSAQLLDGVTFGLAVLTLGISSEMNPFMVLLYSSAGLGGVMAVKVLGSFTLAAISMRVGRWWLLPAWVGVIGAASNVWALA